MNYHDNSHFKAALPDALEAEQALLGAIMLNNEAYWNVAKFLEPIHFIEKVHQQIFETLAGLIKDGRTANPITIKPHLPFGQVIRQDQDGNALTLQAYVARLVAEAVNVINAADFGSEILEAWGRRQLCAAAEDLDSLSRSMPLGMTSGKVIAETSARLISISEAIGEKDSAITMGDAIGEAMKAIDDAYKFKKSSGITTGVESVDSLTGPWEAGQQIIIGGGTKQGKTALAMQCVVGAAKNGPVWIYSGEMSIKQLAMREIARRTGIPARRQKEGNVSKMEWEHLHAVREEVSKLPILIEKRRLTLEQIHQTCRDIKRRHGLAAMAIDHVGLLAWGKDDVRREEAALSAKATQQLKAIYEDLGIPGISLVQFKKNTFVYDFRGTFINRMRDAINRRPKYTDLLGAVERDADHVLIPFNPRPILAGLEPEDGSDDHILWEGKMQEVQNRAEIILALSREHSFPQRRQVEWNGETTSFGPAFVGKQENLLGDDY